MAQCPDGHLFCLDCCKKGSEEVLGSGKTQLKCYTRDCTFNFTPSEIKKFLPKKTFEYYQKRLQEEDISQVDIPNLERCPYCNFAVIVENDSDKIFRCLSAECKKESCRLCKEESHIPLRCDEVEKKGERDKRLFVEDKMTDALLRVCNNPRCKKPFFKEDGCNHMKCTCGWEMCYVCRQTIKGYKHFQVEGGCVLHDDTVKKNKENVKKAEKAAKSEYDKNLQQTTTPTSSTTTTTTSNGSSSSEKRANKRQRTSIDLTGSPNRRNNNNNNNNNNNTPNNNNNNRRSREFIVL